MIRGFAAASAFCRGGSIALWNSSASARPSLVRASFNSHDVRALSSTPLAAVGAQQRSSCSQESSASFPNGGSGSFASWSTLGAAVVGAGLACLSNASNTPAQSEAKVFTRADVAKHDNPKDGIWVMYKDGVYNITEFVANHPGGQDKIMMAAGKSIDAYWNLYRQHLNNETASDLLNEMQIGVLDSNEPREEVDESNPYSKDPARHPGLKFHSTQPCNAELPVPMMDSWITPNEVWFVRHHHPVPIVDIKNYVLEIKGEGLRPTTFTLDELKTKFPKRKIVSTIQCGGNRRADMNQAEKTSGTAWGCGAISTAEWGGIRLLDVLHHCGLTDPEGAQVAHVQFVAADEMTASVPVEKVFNPYGDVLLAYEMNGEDIPLDHGYPVRAVVPGHVGVRNVKWVTAVIASAEEAKGPWQSGMAYKMLPSTMKDLTGVDVESKVSMQEQPVQSAITSPQRAAVVEGDQVEVKGYAWSGGGRGIVGVDVSADRGLTWHHATLTEGATQPFNRAWAWVLWSTDVPIPADLKGAELSLCCRATDIAANSQPEQIGPTWNMRGLATNTWDRVTVSVARDE